MTSSSLVFENMQQQTKSTIFGHLDCTIKAVETKFNDFAASIDFTAFCVIYVFVLIWALKKFNRKGIFRPKNKELVDWKTKIKKDTKEFIISLPIIKQYVQKKFKEGMKEVEAGFAEGLEKGRDPHKSHKLPTEGMKKQKLQARIQKWAKQEEENIFCGKLSGMVYAERKEFCKQITDFAAKYMYHNPLHLDAFKELSKMEGEVLAMTANLVSKERLYGMITSGGSESLIMTLYAYKNYYKKQRPNIVVPNTIHAAIDKGASYFNIEVRKTRLNEHYEADLRHMQSMIDGNTIAIYGSYPNYPHGIIDPIADMAKLALKYKIGFHIDACLGGLVAAFLKEHEGKLSMDIEGVTSISLDHHKYGLAPKGVSTVFTKTRELRQHMYFVYADWIGGLYGTPSFVGSRPGFASAGAWYALTHIGKKQYTENALEVSGATKAVAEGLRRLGGVEVFGNPIICVIAFNTTEVDIYQVCNYLKKKHGWHMSALHLPKSVHICVTPANAQNIKKYFVENVKEAIAELKKQPPKQCDTAAIYGATAQIPSSELGEEMMRTAMKVTFS